MNRRLFALMFLSLAIFPQIARACDPCALYNAARLQGHNEGTFTLSVSEQLTSFDRAQDTSNIQDGESVREFSTTQFSLSYDATRELGFQVTMPVMARSYDEFNNYRGDSESDSGIGDMTLAATYSFINYKNADWAVLGGATFGVKLPTGDTGVLGEVAEEDEEDATKYFKHHSLGSGSGGRALTFGSGSVDYIFGLYSLARYQRYLLLGNAQYAIRTEGDYNYQFGNDFLWNTAAGYYFYIEHDVSVAALGSFSGEFKPKDHLNDEVVLGSQYSNLYVGPGILAAIGSLSAEAGIDFRVTGEDVDATVVPETRLKLNLSYTFS